MQIRFLISLSGGCPSISAHDRLHAARVLGLRDRPPGSTSAADTGRLFRLFSSPSPAPIPEAGLSPAARHRATGAGPDCRTASGGRAAPPLHPPGSLKRRPLLCSRRRATSRPPRLPPGLVSKSLPLSLDFDGKQGNLRRVHRSRDHGLDDPIGQLGIPLAPGLRYP